MILKIIGDTNKRIKEIFFYLLNICKERNENHKLCTINAFNMMYVY